MKPAKKRSHVFTPFRESDLFRLELRVARRADKLWRKAGYGSGKDLRIWLQAESEVIGARLGLALPSEPLLAAAR
jgi:hypothetical protein